MPLIVPQAEWEAAQLYFKENPNEAFFPKPDRSQHSFIKIGETLYALSRQKVATEGIRGKGAEGIVKDAINNAGKSIAVKIRRGVKLLPPDNPALLVMQKLGIFIGQCWRHVKKKQTTKLYVALELAQGLPLQDRLAELLKEKDKASAELKIFLMSLKCAAELYTLQLLNIIHGDVKPQNIIVDNDLSITYIDYSFSKIIPVDTDYIFGLPQGTPGWAAPELSSGKYSFSSDVYALGFTLKWMRMSYKLPLKEMLDKEDFKRIKLPEVISEMIHEISQKQPNFEAEKTLQRARGLTAPFFLKKLERGMTLEELCKHFVINSVLSQDQRDMIAISCFKIIEKHHKKNQIVMDISPMNFNIKLEGQAFSVELLNPYYIKQLDSSKGVINGYNGVQDFTYLAPESSLPQGQYSLASDIYCLGKMIALLGYAHEGMTAHRPENRVTIAQVIEDFNKTPNASPIIHSFSSSSLSDSTLSTDSNISEPDIQKLTLS